MAGRAWEYEVLGQTATQFTFTSPGSFGIYEVVVHALGDGMEYEWEGERASLTVTLATHTPVPTSTATDTPVPATDKPADAPPRATDPPPRATDPPPREPTECPEVCSASSGVWSVYDDRRIQDHNACWIERYERKLQQYTCTCTGRQYNKVVEDWKFVSSHSC